MASDFFLLRRNNRNFLFLPFFLGGVSACSVSVEAVLNFSAEATFSTSFSAGVPGFSIVATCLLVAGVSTELTRFSVDTIEEINSFREDFSTKVGFSAVVISFSDGVKDF